MEERETQNINLLVYDTRINVNVPKDQEEHWRKAVQLINEKLNAYFSVYKDKKKDTEICYYAMIDIALNCISQSERNDVSPVMNILTQLSSEIEQAMK